MHFNHPKCLLLLQEKISSQKVQIKIYTQRETNSFPFPQLNAYGVSDYSLYHENDVIIPPGNIVE